MLVGGGTDLVLIANGVTFAVSAVVLSRLDFGRAPVEAEEHEGSSSLFADAMEGLRAARGIPGLWTILFASAVALFFGGLVNVAELPFVKEDLDASDASFSAVVALAGVGIAAGSIAGGAGGSPTTLRGRYVLGLFLIGFGFLVSGLAPGIELLLVTFVVDGLRQRADARLRAADHPGARARPPHGAHLRREGRPHGVGLRALLPRGGRARRACSARARWWSPPAPGCSWCRPWWR